MSEPSLLSCCWAGDAEGDVTQVAYRMEPPAGGTRLNDEHTGFAGVGGWLLARLVPGPVRKKKMLDRGLPAVLDDKDTEGSPPRAL